MLSVLEHTISKQLIRSSSRPIWAGSECPFDWLSNTAIYDASADYRSPAAFHQQFDLVWLVERDLGQFKAWVIILDEALRLMSPGAVLFVRAKDSPFLSMFGLKSHLASWGHMKLLFEAREPDGTLTIAVRNLRPKARSVASDEVSFCVVSDGERLPLLERFIESVHQLRNPAGVRTEVLVCGPERLGPALKHAKLIVEPTAFTREGWITAKKNILVGSAIYENIVVSHDRYELKKEFLERLADFGWDFSLMVCRQQDQFGNRMPDWISAGSAWSVTRNGRVEYGDWNPYVFIGGGFLVAKRDVLLEVPWNELLFWNQAEDIEHSRRLMSRGHVPRLARNVAVQTDTVRAGYKENFEVLPYVDDRYVVPGPVFSPREHVNPELDFGVKIDFSAHSMRKTALGGVHVSKEWLRCSDGLVLEGGQACLSIRIPSDPPESLNVVFEIESESKVECRINEETVQLASFGNVCSASIARGVYRFGQNVTINFFASGTLIVRKLWLEAGAGCVAELGRRYFFCKGGNAVGALAHGWSEPESFGCWSVADSARVTFSSDAQIELTGMEIHAVGFFGPLCRERIVGISINDLPISHLALIPGCGLVYTLALPRGTGRALKMNIDLISQNRVSPLECGVGRDDRRLGVGLVGIALY